MYMLACGLMCTSLCGYKACVYLGTFSEEHKELQQFYSCKNKESEGVVLKLQSHLKNVQTDLDQVRSTLRTLEATDGHGRHMVSYFNIIKGCHLVITVL